MQLSDYDQLNPVQRERLKGLEVHPEQQLHAGAIDSALYLLSSANREQIRGLVLLLDGEPCGFMLLQRGLRASWSEPGAATVSALQIDRRYQGRGLWRLCMQALPGWVHGVWPEVERLQLSVDPGNQAAIACYRATGWHDTGNGYPARVGYERRFTFLIGA